MITIDIGIAVHTLANRVDPDQTAPREQSDLGLHCLQYGNGAYGKLVLKTTCNLFKNENNYNS